MFTKRPFHIFLSIFMITTLLVIPNEKAKAASIIVVNSTADNTTDNSFCTLREAIINANGDSFGNNDCIAGTGNDTIQIDDSLANGTIVLGSALPTITDPDGLSIIGLPYFSSGEFGITISGNNAYQVFYNTAPLTLDQLIIKNGDATNFGGGVYNGSTLIVTNSIFSGNHSDFSLTSKGGAVYNNGTLVIDGTSFSDNVSKVGSAVHNNNGGIVTITNSSFSDNIGSAVANSSSGTMTISNSIFTDNSEDFRGGAITNEGTLEVSLTTFSGNSANDGGAIYNSSSLKVTKSTFQGNTTPGSGGGINNHSIAEISNSTFANNSAVNGGGLYSDATQTITNSTFSANTATNGGGIYNANILNLYNSILANSVSGGDCINGATINGNHNLIEATGSNACGLIHGNSNNIIGSDPNLGTLIGSPMYFPLNTGSPAINAGNDLTCAAAPVSNTSQNGVTRPQGSHCDLGAFEYIIPMVSSIVRDNPNPTSATSVGFVVTFSTAVTGVDTADFSLVTTGVSGASITGVSGSGSTRNVSVNTGSGSGSIRLDVPVSATITNLSANPIGGLPFISGEVYNVSKSPTFADVSFNHFAWAYIESLYNAGITGGCTTSPLNYCPENSVTRAQMAIFILKGIHTSSYTPPPVGGSTGFADVPTDYWAAAWIKQLAAEGITGGCNGSNYCPDSTVTRDQMAVFLLKAKHGASYSPPAVGGNTGFADVPVDHWAAAWIKQLAAESITGGCDGSNYCPVNPVTRAQMAIFLQKTFNLPLP